MIFHRAVALFVCGLCSLVLGTSEGTAAEASSMIRGRVLTGSGLALEQARIEPLRDGQAVSGTAVFSDFQGRFTVQGCELPCLLLVTHPRFEEQAVEVRDASEVEVTLVAKATFDERIDVTATRGGGDSFAPLSVASTEIRPQEKAAAPSSLTELIEGTPGVAENGQGGLFQVFSIRGVSRQRVLTLVSGMQVTSERRAGVSTSFIDPLLIGSVDVLRGPASTYYGSGALGGVVQVFPRQLTGWQLDTGYDSFGDEHYQHVGWGDPEAGWSLGLAQRTMDDDEAADGTPLNNHFTQYSAAISKRWQSGERSYELLALPSLGQDIGKPNSDFPERVTNYPQETHLLLKFGMQSERGWNFDAFVHPSNLRTEVIDVGEGLSEVRNESFDLGASWQQRWSWAGRDGGKGLEGRLGVDYFGRRAVTAMEREEDSGGTVLSETRTLDDGERDDLAAFGSVRWAWGAVSFQAGSRVTWQQQTNGSEPSADDTAWTGFLGLVRPLSHGFELTANVGTGLRFPSLSERFFTGSTGRGQVIGNPALDSEGSLNIDLGVRWYGQKAFVSAQTFQLDIDDYIERITLPDGRRTFVNLTSGTIRGFELEGFYRANEHWMFTWGGHLLDGEDASGEPLADISPHRLEVGAEHQRGDWRSRVRLQVRGRKDDPGSGELEIPGATLVSASLSYRLSQQLRLTLRGRNLLDEDYFNSADDMAVPAAGRSLGLSLSWATGS